MSTHTHTPIGKNEVPDISLLPSKDARRKFRTGTYTETVALDLDTIDIGGGTEKNKARALGTDTNHISDLLNEFTRGIRYEQLPPIVVKEAWMGGNYMLVDGFTRVAALKEKEQVTWVFDVYELEKGYILKDLLTEIGLGANNHVASKKSKPSDFVTPGIEWVERQPKDTISKVQIKEWVNNIPHSFNKDQVNTTVDKIYNAVYPDRTVATFTESRAAVYLDALGYSSKGLKDDDGLHGRTFAASSNATHGPRNFCHMLKDFKETGRKTRVNLFAPNGTPAKDVQKVIEAQKAEFLLWAEAIQEMAVHIKADKNWVPFEFGVRPSQIVEVDPDGGVVPLSDTAPEPNPKTEVDEFAELDTTFNQ